MVSAHKKNGQQKMGAPHGCATGELAAHAVLRGRPAAVSASGVSVQLRLMARPMGLWAVMAKLNLSQAAWLVAKTTCLVLGSELHLGTSKAL